MNTVALIGALDTKGEEYAWFRERIHTHQTGTVMIDVGILGSPSVASDVSAEDVARAGGTTLAALRSQHDRGKGVEAMATGAAVILRDMVAAERITCVAALGGSNGTRLATAAMRELPIGFPKVMVSTMASGNVRPYVGGTDIAMLYSVVDIAGINAISGRVLSNAAAMIAGLAKSAPFKPEAARPLVVVSSFGVTTPAVTSARKRLDDLGYDSITFHATGSGGQSLESFIAYNDVVGLLDITTSEIGCDLFGGALTAGPRRMEAAGRRGLPQVVSVGAADMVSFGTRETVPERYASRHLYAHNATVTVMRTSCAECRAVGREIAGKLNTALGPAAVFIPLRGVSALDVPGGRFEDAAADRALFEELEACLDGDRVECVKLSVHINDPAFGAAMVDHLHMLIASTSPIRRAS